MALIKGIHHIQMKCTSEAEYEKVMAFYTVTLGMTVKRSWPNGAMVDTGSGLLEIFKDGEHPMEQGVIRHVALATDDVDACIDAVKAAGYHVFVEPKDVVIPSNPAFPIRVAFCKGPLGEDVEFFKER